MQGQTPTRLASIGSPAERRSPGDTQEARSATFITFNKFLNVRGSKLRALGVAKGAEGSSWIITLRTSLCTGQELGITRTTSARQHFRQLSEALQTSQDVTACPLRLLTSPGRRAAASIECSLGAPVTSRAILARSACGPSTACRTQLEDLHRYRRNTEQPCALMLNNSERLERTDDARKPRAYGFIHCAERCHHQRTRFGRHVLDCVQVWGDRSATIIDC